MHSCVAEERATVYVCVHMPKKYERERKDVHVCCRKILAAQQKRVFFGTFGYSINTKEPSAKFLPRNRPSVVPEAAPEAAPRALR